MIPSREPFCTYGRCGNPRHDHLRYFRDDGFKYDIPIPLVCPCGLPAHFDFDFGRPQHDDSNADDCLYIARVRSPAERYVPIPRPELYVPPTQERRNS